MTLLLYKRFGGMFSGNLNSIAKRQFSKSPTILCQKNLREKYSRENVRTQVSGYMFTRFIDYVQNYDKLLEKKFPSAMNVYRVFLVGVKDFYNDMKRYLKIQRIIGGSSLGMRALTRKEIELYTNLPKEMMKVAPVLLLSALPFANYVVFPIAFMYPRHFLSTHFWSIEQKSLFQQLNLKKRLTYNLKVFRCLQALRQEYKTHNEWKYDEWKRILGLIESGLHPASEEILSVNDIFIDGPYSLDNLSSTHIKYLCKLHDIRGVFFRRLRLAERSFKIHHMDLAIKREGGVHNMPLESLRDSCYIRGLNSNNLSNESMIKWLEEWIKVSLKVDGSNISLFLHLPILIAYNHPNNRVLLYGK